MKPLSQTRQALVEEWKENMRIGLGLDDEDVEVAKNHLTQALNDYTESIVRMVEGKIEKEKSTEPHPDEFIITDGINHFAISRAKQSALNDIKEALNDTK